MRIGPRVDGDTHKISVVSKVLRDPISRISLPLGGKNDKPLSGRSETQNLKDSTAPTLLGGCVVSTRYLYTTLTTKFVQH